MSLPEDRRQSPEIPYQRTWDGRVADFLRKAGFRALELTGDWSDVGDGGVRAIPWRGGDSMLLADFAEVRILAWNDCVGETQLDMDKIGEILDSSVDLLLTQVSYASWI